MRFKNAARIALTLALSALIFYLALRGFDFRKFLAALKEADASFILPIILVILLSSLLMALRWMYILKGIKVTKTYVLFKAIILGWFANILLPLNVGLLYKTYFAAKKEKISVSSAFGSVAVEKVADGLSFLALIGFVFLFLELPPLIKEIETPLRKAVSVSSLLLVLFILFLLLFKGYALKVKSFASSLLRPFAPKYSGRFLEALALFEKGIRVGRSGTDIFFITVISMLMRIALAGITYLVALSVGLELDFMVFFFIEVFVGLIYSLAVTLGIVGSFEVAVVVGLGFFGVGKEIALSVALIQDALSFLVIVTLGGFFVFTENLHLKELVKPGKG